ncbi:MAG: hypothetical protein ACI9OJ_003092 [Myxococcota bacterium]|jgi:hypothetical protein
MTLAQTSSATSQGLAHGLVGRNGTADFDIESVRQYFPILGQKVYGNPLVYLDSAATSQKPQAVIDARSRFLLKEKASVHRGVHYLAERATQAYEGARAKARGFLNAKHAHEIIFARATTEAINLLAQTYGKKRVGEGDEMLAAHEEVVLAYGTRMLSAVPGLRLIDTAHAKASVLSFVLDGGSPPHDIDALVTGLGKVREVFQGGLPVSRQMSCELRDLYQEMVIEHSRHPRNVLKLDDPTSTAEGFNRVCRDQLTLDVKRGDGVIEDIALQRDGCVISKVPASLMTAALKGKKQQEALALLGRVHALLTVGPQGEGEHRGRWQARGAVPHLGIPVAGQVRHPCVAHVAQRPQRNGCTDFNGVNDHGS